MCHAFLLHILLTEKNLTLAILLAGANPAPAKLLIVLGLGAELGVTSTGVDVVGALAGALVGGVADAVIDRKNLRKAHPEIGGESLK